MNESSRHGSPVRRRRRGRLLVWPLAALLVAGGVLRWCAYRRQQELTAAAVAELRREQDEAEARLKAATDEAERLDGPWRVADVAARQETIPEEENSARTLHAVQKKMPPGWPTWSGSLFQDSVFLDVPPPVPLAGDRLAELRAEMARAAAAVQEARQLADRPRGRLPLPWSRPSAGDLWETPDVGPAPNLLRFDAFLRGQEGDLEGALLSCRAIVNAAAGVGDTPTFAAQRFRTDTRDLAIPPLERALALGEVPAAALAALQARLAEEAELPLMLLAARGERAALDQLCAAAQAGTVPASAVLGDNRKEPEPPADEDPDLLRARLDARLARARAVLLEKMNQKVEIHKLPPQQHGRLQDLAKSGRNDPAAPALFGLAAVEVWGWRRSQARLRSAAAALAAERYRLRKGGWPERLADLVPEYLPAVPADPFSGEPLRYRRQTEGVAVYSVGSYLKDGGGEFETLGVSPPNDNVGFRLWDTDRRHRPEK